MRLIFHEIIFFVFVDCNDLDGGKNLDLMLSKATLLTLLYVFTKLLNELKKFKGLRVQVEHEGIELIIIGYVHANPIKLIAADIKYKSTRLIFITCKYYNELLLLMPKDALYVLCIRLKIIISRIYETKINLYFKV